jgi:riboflavin biosynthesis pyrimidine reductase
MQQLIPSFTEMSQASELEAFYELPPGQGHLRVNFVSSLDGVVEVSGRSGPLGNEGDRAAFMALRAVADAIMVGAGTVRAEKYGPVRLDEAARGRRAIRDQSELPRLAIVSVRGDLDPKMGVFDGPSRPLVLTTERVRSEQPRLGEIADVIACGDTQVDLRAARQALWSQGLARVLCEGGPTLFRSLLIDDLVDEMCLSLAPLLAGAEHKHLTGDEPLPELAEFRLQGLLESDGVLLGRYGRIRRHQVGAA